MKIEHIAMYVNELEAARNFFVTYLGGKSNDGYHNKNTDFRSYFISFADGARLELMTKLGWMISVGGKVILPSLGKDFFHRSVSSFLHESVSSFFMTR